jgi:hypothetical protein
VVECAREGGILPGHHLGAVLATQPVSELWEQGEKILCENGNPRPPGPRPDAVEATVGHLFEVRSNGVIVSHSFLVGDGIDANKLKGFKIIAVNGEMWGNCKWVVGVNTVVVHDNEVSTYSIRAYIKEEFKKTKVQVKRVAPSRKDLSKSTSNPLTFKYQKVEYTLLLHPKRMYSIKKGNSVIHSTKYSAKCTKAGLIAKATTLAQNLRGPE